MSEAGNKNRLYFVDDNGEDYQPWVNVKIGDFAHAYQPKTVGKKDFTLDGYPVYGANGVIGNYHKYNHEDAEVLVACRGTCGNVLMSQPKSWINGNAMVIQPTVDINKKYMFHLLSASPLKDIVDGSVQPQITRQPLLNLKVKTSQNLSEQYKIGSFLSSLDDRIEQQERLVGLLTQQKQATIQRIFTQQLKFTQDNGEEYPEWETKKLGDICKSISSSLAMSKLSQDPSDGVPVYSANGVVGYYPDRVVNSRYFTIIKDGAGIGRTQWCEPNTAFIGTLTGIVPKEDNDLGFIYYLVNSLDIQSVKVGTAIPHIYFSEYSRFKINVPSVEEQHKIGSLLTCLDKRLGLQVDYLGLLRGLKQAYLQRLFG